VCVVCGWVRDVCLCALLAVLGLLALAGPLISHCSSICSVQAHTSAKLWQTHHRERGSCSVLKYENHTERFIYELPMTAFCHTAESVILCNNVACRKQIIAVLLFSGPLFYFSLSVLRCVYIEV